MHGDPTRDPDHPGARTEPVLTNPRSERVRSVAALSERSARRRAGLFVAEGPQAVREAVTWGAGRPGAVRDVFASVAAAARHTDLLDAARSAGAHVRECTDEVLAAMSGTTTPQGLLATCTPVDVSLEQALSARPPLVAVLAHVRDPGNAGTVLRAADAAGAGAVVLTGDSVDVHNPKCVRASAGSLFHVDVVTGADLAATVAALRAAGTSVLAADGGGATDLDDLLDAAEAGTGPLAGPVAWVLGNEAWGLRPQDRDLADAVVRVPLHGRAESLNLAAAATVCLYAAARGARRARRAGKPGTARR